MRVWVRVRVRARVRARVRLGEDEVEDEGEGEGEGEGEDDAVGEGVMLSPNIRSKSLTLFWITWGGTRAYERSSCSCGPL